MDSDRRSGYAQYYGTDNNGNAANSRGSMGFTDAHARQGSLAGAGAGTGAGGAYGRNSYSTSSPFKPDTGDDMNPEDGWNVYSDFNNTGPRYSALRTNSDGYQALPTPPTKGPKTPGSLTGTETGTPVELVTVPKLGAEWRADELRAMTKKGKNEEKNYARRERWKAWTRDQTGICGKWGTRKTIVWSLFVIIIVTGILLAILLPRVPKFDYNSEAPLAAADNDPDPPVFGVLPANFSFNAALDLKVNTHNNILPVRFKHLRAELIDLDTSESVATGDLGAYTLPAKAYTQVLLPITFNYTAANRTDRTFSDVYNSCRNKNQFEGGVRPGMNLRILLFMEIAGLVTKSSTSTTLNGAPCPFELPSSAG